MEKLFVSTVLGFADLGVVWVSLLQGLSQDSLQG